MWHLKIFYLFFVKSIALGYTLFSPHSVYPPKRDCKRKPPDALTKYLIDVGISEKNKEVVYLLILRL
ncbi:hypothetical protein BVE84_05370 [Streptococcus azizii]|uniref:Uncharacterized protein n=1 Tax=Streptococcus azizii TaxID=1579424 RepID=A0AB36JPT6_9STRE|nr:hypothetical protein BVE86_09775 [Streptococcus azizii]ONK28241.1 hypothetical protein BVE85_05355 [Streptococcus azizii]ONK29021.1 hypothetical protein BVE84_05370 [Streptococcus azizii]